jgi:Ring finger domain
MPRFVSRYALPPSALTTRDGASSMPTRSPVRSTPSSNSADQDRSVPTSMTRGSASTSSSVDSSSVILQGPINLLDGSISIQSTRSVPPASSRAISELSCTRIYPSDDPTHQYPECSVCMEVCAPRSLVAKMPCGHQFHLTCIVPWLRETCTCPDCRYELHTEDAEYEVGRKQRMTERMSNKTSCLTLESRQNAECGSLCVA